MTFLVDAFVQTRPQRWRRSRTQVLSKKPLDRSALDTSRTVWVRNLPWSYEEAATATVETLQYTRKCRVSGHEWTETKARQRPW